MKDRLQSSPRRRAGRLTRSTHQEESYWLAEAVGGVPGGLIPRRKNATFSAAPKCRNFIFRSSDKSTTSIKLDKLYFSC